MSCRIVICDDQASFREVLRLMLALEEDFTVVGEAANGRDVIEVVRELQPDVLLLDVAMPVMDGLEALPHVRAAAPDTAVVVLTALTTDGVRRRALDEGARLVVEKGTNAEELASRVRAACAG